MVNKMYYTIMMILVIITMFYASFKAVEAQDELKHVYAELKSRCIEPSHFEKDTLSCVITYQVP